MPTHRAPHDQPPSLRPVRRAPGPLHLRRHLGRRGLADSEHRGIRTDIIDALKAIKIPDLRWPGGCFADDYHWRDGIGPRDQRPLAVNIHWGGVVETNAFGTHEFLDLVEQIGAEPYIAGNVGSGTPQEMRDWIEYMTFDGTATPGQPAPQERPRQALEDHATSASATKTGAAAAT